MRKALISISSTVVRGSVGNRAAVFALESLGHPVWSVPTIILPYHPGHGPGTRIVPDLQAFSALLDDLLHSKWMDEIAGILTGYMADAGQVRMVARFIGRARERNPDLLHFCDPVMGDNGRLYVAGETAAAIRDNLVSQCDVLSPNPFELSWLSGRPAGTLEDCLAAARSFEGRSVLVTSAPGMEPGTIGNLLVDGSGAFLVEHERIANAPNGPGDLTAAILFSHRVRGIDARQSLTRTAAAVLATIRNSVALGSDELVLDMQALDVRDPQREIRLRILEQPDGGTAREGRTRSVELLVGIDGCRKGWIAAFVPAGAPGYLGAARLEIFPDFTAILSRFGRNAIYAVDMPIGLPERSGAGGRGPERAVRPLLGNRQSSVFSIPSRRAVYAAGYREACAIALETSDPPRRIAKQAFNIFPRIIEIDSILRVDREWPVHEVHPEFAFLALNDGVPMRMPKKIRNRANPDGLSERREVLARAGFSATVLEARIAGAGADDILDACACLAIAGRIARGEAHPWPDPFERDAHGLPMAIWA